MKDVSKTALCQCLISAWLSSVSLFGQEPPLSPQQPTASSSFAASIDQWIQTATAAPPADLEQDALLLRKLWISVIGLAPTLDEANQYLADSSPDRYFRMVDHLLFRPEFNEHWAEKFDVMLMERRPNTHITQDHWAAWLRSQMAANRPLNHMLADLLVADGAPGESRAAGRFLLDRSGDPNLITNDVGRIYFGRDIQCSQCHNHPSIDSYRQSDYQGLFGFVSGIHLVEIPDGEKKIQMVAEKSVTDSPFESVFQRGTMHRVLPHLFGEAEFAQPWTIPGEDYQPAETGRPAKPIHSRRQQLADAIRTGNVEAFNRNLANRLWSMVFGRGVVEPVDLHHADNPPLSDELLQGLSKQLAQSGFGLRNFVRELVLTKTFQRGRLELEASGQQAPSWLAISLQGHTERLQLAEQNLKMAGERRAQAEREYSAALDASAAIQKERLTALGSVDSARGALSQAVEAAKKAAAEKQTAEQSLAVALDKQVKLQAAADSSAAALLSVGQDAELAAAAELFKNRLAAIQATVEPLQKTLEEKSAASQVAVEASAKAKETLLAAQQVATEINLRYREVSTANHRQRSVFEEAALRFTQAAVEVNYQKTLSAWIDSSERAAKLAQEIEQNHKDRALSEVSLAGLIPTKQAAQQKLTEMLVVADSLVGQVNTKKALIDSINVDLRRVSDANGALAEAAELVKAPEKVGPTLEALETTSVALRAKLVEAEKELASARSASDSRQSELAQLKETLSQLQSQVEVTENQLRDGTQKQTELEAKLESVRIQKLSSLNSIANLFANRFLSSRLRPLTPEQIGWSFLATTNVYKNYVDKHLAEIEKATPSTTEQSQDAAFLAGRRAEAVRRARAELQGNINHFVTLYGAGPGQPQSDFFATPDQALYASNGGAIFAWATASGENVTARVVAANSSVEAVERLYLGVLSRKPTPVEVLAVEQYLGQQPEIRARLAQELVWSLMASAEFRFLP